LLQRLDKDFLNKTFLEEENEKQIYILKLLKTNIGLIMLIPNCWIIDVDTEVANRKS